MMSSSSRASVRSTAKIDAEKRMVRRREREYDHQAKWNDQVRYYKSWEKTNNKFEEWTSPRYYQDSNRMIQTLKQQREHKEELEKRREKLRKLLTEEDRTHEIELMVKNRHRYVRKVVPTQVLKEVNVGLKLAEDDRRRHEAELALYHQWRNDNPTLRDHERTRATKDVKLSWLDRQVEKRLEKERVEEECRQVLAERERRVAEEAVNEERLERETAEKNQRLRAGLEKQIEELKLKQKQSEDLQRKEEAEVGKLAELSDIEERRRADEKRRMERELALENLKQHKLKLKQRAADVREDLENNRTLVRKLVESQAAEEMEDETKKREVKRAMAEFLKFARDQEDLEKQRQKHFDFVFDSEAKLVYERQLEVWSEERKARERLLKDVLDTVKEQIDEKVQKNKEKQRAMLEERRNALKLVEEYDEDMRRNKEQERRKKEEWKTEIAEQIKEKEARQQQAKLREQKKIDWDLEEAKKEEERLRREIADLQRRQGPIRHVRSRILF